MALVVIVDDSATNRRIFEKLTGSIEKGIAVRSFGSPNDALGWMADNTPDLVVTDFKMPGMDGAEFIRRIRAVRDLNEIPVIVITVYEERDFRLRALEAGATDFLQSPVDHQEFVTRARNLLKLRNQQRLLATRAVNLAHELEESQRSREEELRDSSERLAQVIDTVPAMISATDRDGRTLFVNAYHSALIGGPRSEANGPGANGPFGGDLDFRNKMLDRKVISTETALPSFEQEIVDYKGTKRIFLTTKTPLRGRSNTVVGVLTSALDITDRKRAESHLFHLAHHDMLTGLPNRVLLLDRLRREIARTRRGDSLFALHLIDLDGFKAINDGLGHQSGDRFLVEISNRLRALVRDSDTVARLGGDEFAVVQTGVAGTADVTKLAVRIIEAVDKPWRDGGGDGATASASVGIAIHPKDGIDAETLLRNSDLAMYRAKNDGGKVHRFFATEMDQRARSSMILDSDLRNAISDEQFTLHYQPQISIATGQIVGAEALVRWSRPGHDLLAPSQFLARAEENGLIVPINEWVLREACRAAYSWQRVGRRGIRVAVNLSSIMFFKKNVPLLVAATLAETGLDPRLLDLELTESIVMHDADAVAKDLQHIRELGVGISIDDFGTRYSTLTYVRQFPIDRLKIDQCFIRDIVTNPSDAAIVRAIVSLGHSLGLEITAEGVETEKQLSILRAEGCDEAQGFYYARPMPKTEFDAFIAQRAA
jgi:diguanylate cyclase (GGDEF)-like protein/PAS domain S-box-containing protein